jgi:hypothetical protein
VAGRQAGGDGVRQGLLFVNKKKQKNFLFLGVPDRGPGLQWMKFFARFFSKKRRLLALA